MSGSGRGRGEEGFTLLETLLATAIVLCAFAVLFQLATTGQRITRTQPEAADLQQRVRVAADMMQRDLLMAGAGLAHGADAGPLVNYLPAIVPYRTGAWHPDPELSFFDDRISILYVEAGATAAALAANMAGAAADVPVDPASPGCPAAGLCGFQVGTRSLVFDGAGLGLGFDLFSARGIAGGLAHAAPDPPFTRAYQMATARVARVRQRVYYIDASTRRLMLYDGYQTDVPLADQVVALKFEYFVDPWAGGVSRPANGASNCVYAAGTPPVPLLVDFGGSTLVGAGAALLTDGPICGISPSSFDGDLLRIRRVRVTLRAQVADVSLRGRGSDFAAQGLSSSGESYVPDMEVSFDVSPRNMLPTR